MVKRGPYVNDDGSEIYLPVEGWTLNDARREAASHARMEMGEHMGRARYTGKKDVPLHDHEDWWGCEVCASVPSWTFETYEGAWR